MNLTEILTLAKAGYKAKDINQMIEDEKKRQEEENSPKSEDNIQEAEDKVQEAKGPETKEPEIDYKKLYEESQAKLKNAQAANIHQNAQTEQPKDEEALAELFKNLI